MIVILPRCGAGSPPHHQLARLHDPLWNELEVSSGHSFVLFSCTVREPVALTSPTIGSQAGCERRMREEEWWVWRADVKRVMEARCEYTSFKARKDGECNKTYEIYLIIWR